MARVHRVERAAKDYPNDGIKKGEPYYWWQLWKGPKRRSSKPPRRSQLTGSSFLAEVYDLEDEIADWEGTDASDLRSNVDDWAQRIRDLGDQAQESLDAMPESLQQGPTGEMLQSRVDACEDWATGVESVDVPEVADEDNPTDEETEAFEAALEELRGLSYEGE